MFETLSSPLDFRPRGGLKVYPTFAEILAIENPKDKNVAIALDNRTMYVYNGLLEEWIPLDGIMSPMSPTIFTEFSINARTVREIGATVEAGNYTFSWDIVGDIEPNSITIIEVDTGRVVGKDLPNTGTYSTTLPDISFNTATEYAYRIEARDVGRNLFSKTLSFKWTYRCYIGENSKPELSSSEVISLRSPRWLHEVDGHYNTKSDGYKYVYVPEAFFTDRHSIRITDMETGLHVVQAIPQEVMITNRHGLPINYIAFRSINPLHSSMEVAVDTKQIKFNN